MLVSIQDSFKRFRGYLFHDGKDSMFSVYLDMLVKFHGERAISEVSKAVNALPHDVIGEALRCLGNMDDKETAEARRTLLEHCLIHPSATVRDGAILGISFMGQKESLPYLRGAAKIERVGALKEDIEQVIREIESSP